MHRYNITEAGEMVTTGFYMPGSVFTPHFARTNKGLSIFSIQALTEAFVYKVNAEHFSLLRSRHPDLRLFGQTAVEIELAGIMGSEVAFRSMAARQRLATLRKIYPNLENLIPHSIIASYLGINSVSFSRLRAETG